MARSIKICVLWLLTICGFASHIVCDMMPMFWGKDMALMATDGKVDQGMVVLMMGLAFLVPTCGVLCTLFGGRVAKILNGVLAIFISLFNIAHVFMEMPSENAGQYIVMPLMVVIGIVLAWQSIKYVKEV